MTVEVRKITFTVPGDSERFLDALKRFVAWAEDDHSEWLYFNDFDWQGIAEFSLRYEEPRHEVHAD